LFAESEHSLELGPVGCLGRFALVPEDLLDIPAVSGAVLNAPFLLCTQAQVADLFFGGYPAIDHGIHARQCLHVSSCAKSDSCPTANGLRFDCGMHDAPDPFRDGLIIPSSSSGDGS
jgi:hypothetical protein